MQTPYRKPGKYSSLKTDPLMTEEKYRELESELAHLQKIQLPAAKEVSRLAELGDFSENVEYQLAKGRLRGINSAILKIQNQLDHAEIIQKNKNNTTVQLGHVVTIESEGKQKTYQILGSTETNPGAGIISHTSPLGMTLLGKKVGDTVTMKIANTDKKYTIITIE